MFVTFESATKTDGESPPSKRAKSTLRACQSCRKRKVRCDGKRPCAACQWQRKATSCVYEGSPGVMAPSRPEVPPKKRKQDVLRTLFPDVPTGVLATKSRQQLVEMLSSDPDNMVGAEKISEAQEDDHSLDQLQPLPDNTEGGTALAGSSSSPEAEQAGITDDVNALTMSVKHSVSYLGISSVIAVLRVIHCLDPASRIFSKTAGSNSGFQDKAHRHVVDGVPGPSTGGRAPSLWDEVPAINAYFQYVQPFLPLLDEDSFRETYVSRQRSDVRWKLLLNAVLTMGSVALYDASDHSHEFFYGRIKEHLNFQIFESAHLETVQAVGILTGTYLHYIQQPNLANFLMGGLSRMALTLGLHRDFMDGRSARITQKATPDVNVRRQVWWCLLVMDGWNSNYLGRPTMGRSSTGYTTRLPEASISASTVVRDLLLANIAYCKLSTRFEDLLAERPILSRSNRDELDAGFASWLQDRATAAPEAGIGDTPGITLAKNVMRWRGLISRIYIHRPIMMWYAMRKASLNRLPHDKQHAIITCRGLANELIRDIQTTWHVPAPCQMAGWCATWQLYQATMVPLLSLFCDLDDSTTQQESTAHIEIALSALRDLEKWSPTAKRSLEVVSRIFEAGCAFIAKNAPEMSSNTLDNSSVPLDTPSTADSATMYEGFFVQDFFDELNWQGNQAPAFVGSELELSFLDYWDIGQEGSGML